MHRQPLSHPSPYISLLRNATRRHPLYMFLNDFADAASVALSCDGLFLGRYTGKIDRVTSEKVNELGHDIPITGQRPFTASSFISLCLILPCSFSAAPAIPPASLRSFTASAYRLLHFSSAEIPSTHRPLLVTLPIMQAIRAFVQGLLPPQQPQ